MSSRDRPLTDTQRTKMQRYSDLEAELLKEIAADMPPRDPKATPPSGMKCDIRWLSIAKTHFEEGAMAARRALAEAEIVAPPPPPPAEEVPAATQPMETA